MWIQLLLAGPLFPPRAYGDEGRVWDDREFLKSMWKNQFKWSDKQRALLERRIIHYQRHGRELQGVKDDLPECHACGKAPERKKKEPK